MTDADQVFGLVEVAGLHVCDHRHDGCTVVFADQYRQTVVESPLVRRKPLQHTAFGEYVRGCIHGALCYCPYARTANVVRRDRDGGGTSLSVCVSVSLC